MDDLEPDLPMPAGSKVGYARVSTAGQYLDRQIAALTAAGCIRVFADRKSGKNIEREELWRALDYLRSGDTLVVVSLDRLGEASRPWREQAGIARGLECTVTRSSPSSLALARTASMSRPPSPLSRSPVITHTH